MKFVCISAKPFPSTLEGFQGRRALSTFSEDRMFVSGCLETRYSPARDAGHPGVIGGSEKAHLQGMGAGVFENLMREGRGQQPFWPSSETSNVGTRVLSQGGMKRRQRSEKRDVGKEKEDKKRKGQSQNIHVQSETVTHSDLSCSSASGYLHLESQALLPENLYLNQPQMLCLKIWHEPVGDCAWRGAQSVNSVYTFPVYLNSTPSEFNNTLDRLATIFCPSFSYFPLYFWLLFSFSFFLSLTNVSSVPSEPFVLVSIYPNEKENMK